MKSYNCFYTAIYTVLEKLFNDSTQLLINNRWQFFYKKGEKYSEDKRLLGEHPLLYDVEHLELLMKYAKINIKIIQSSKGLDEIIKIFYKYGYVFIFVNRFCYDSRSHSANEKCVTTIRIDGYLNRQFHYKLFDSDLRDSGWINEELLLNSWMTASEFDFLNQSYIHIEMNNQDRDMKDVRKVFIHSLEESLSRYLEGYTEGPYLYGNQGLINFAKDIMVDKAAIYKTFIDCSMYMNIVTSQRRSLLMALKYYMKDKKVNDIQETQLLSIIEKWGKLKMLLYIMGMRRQSESVPYLRDLIYEIQGREQEYTAHLLQKVKQIQ